MAAGPEKRQRICFFTMVDREKGGLGDTVCMENQQLTQEKVSCLKFILNKKHRPTSHPSLSGPCCYGMQNPAR